MTTSQFHRKTLFVPSNDQATKLIEFSKIRESMSIRKQAQWLSVNAHMSTGDIAVYLDKRFQQIYQATH